MPKYINDGRWHSNDDLTVFRLTNIEGLLEEIRDLLLAERRRREQPRRRSLFRRLLRKGGDHA